jgi:hypothetical protein
MEIRNGSTPVSGNHADSQAFEGKGRIERPDAKTKRPVIFVEARGLGECRTNRPRRLVANGRPPRVTWKIIEDGSATDAISKPEFAELDCQVTDLKAEPGVLWPTKGMCREPQSQIHCSPR